jgi:TPR domain/SEC-C domain protein
MKKKKEKRTAKTVPPKHAVRKIRIGYLSSDFGAGRMRDFLPMFFSAYNRLRFEVYAYHTGQGGDTELFAKENVLREIGACSPAEAADIIRRDKIDLLVDLSPTQPDAFTFGILQRCPARHLVSLAERCPLDYAVRLPAVEGADLLPHCYTPFDPVYSYTYRSPVLDTGVPAIGVSGTLRENGSAELLQLLTVILPQMSAVRLILPAAIAEGLSEADFEHIAEMGTEASTLDLVDELPYDELDLLIGIHADLLDVCRAAEQSVPLLSSASLIDCRYACMLMERVGLPAAQSIEEMGAQACRLCADVQRLSELHELLHWRLLDTSDTGTAMLSLERSYDRILACDVVHAPEKLSAWLAHAADTQGWDAVLYSAHLLDGMDRLEPEQRMSLAWAYFFRDALTLAGYWALLAEGVPQDREGARLYLSVVSASPPGTSMEIYTRAHQGLALIDSGLSVVEDVHAILLKMCSDHGAYVRDSETASAYAMAYSRKTQDLFMRRCYYGAGLFRLNAVNLPAREVYQKSLAYADFFSDIQQFSHRNRRIKDKIRIGYISGDFRQHVMQYFIWPFLAGFDSAQFEVYVYSLGKSDQYSNFFQTLVTKWRDLTDHARNMERIAREIYEDEVDILFDLAGHTAASGLAALAWKPAPVQLTGLGYMATTGLPAVDYFVTDHYCDPESSGSESVYVEKLLRLTSQFCYNGYTNLPVSKGTPARRKGYIQFASFNQYVKLHDDMLLAWRDIMERVPDARLLLKNSAYARHGIASLAHERLCRLGFDMSRVQFEGATRDYMVRYLDIDIALDTFPWPGGGTTCDALYMGVPVVSYYTERHSTRFTYSLLANMGLAALASESLKDYVETAVALAGNLDLLDALHRELRSRMQASPVMDQERYIREMEEHYRAIWATWEAQQRSV